MSVRIHFRYFIPDDDDDLFSLGSDDDEDDDILDGRIFQTFHQKSWFIYL